MTGRNLLLEHLSDFFEGASSQVGGEEEGPNNSKDAGRAVNKGDSGAKVGIGRLQEVRKRKRCDEVGKIRNRPRNHGGFVSKRGMRNLRGKGLEAMKLNP